MRPHLKRLRQQHLTSTSDNDEAVKSEVQEFLDTRQQRRLIFPRAALVGLCAGVIALAFRAALSSADTLRNSLITWAQQKPAWGWIFPVALGIAGALTSVILVRRFAPKAAGSGIPHLEAVLHRLSTLEWKRILPVKFFGGIIAIGSGMALGREGPTVQMGGAIGEALARLLKTSERERLTLISAGAGAGLAAAFNAPLSGLIFVLEEVRRDFQPIVFGATFVAAVIADIIARIGAGQFPVFSVPSYEIQPLPSLLYFVLLGVITGVLGAFFNRGLLKSISLFNRIPKKYYLIVIALVGAMIGLAGWFYPDLIGSGHALVESALTGKMVLSIIPVFFILRFLLTSTSYSTGAPGGIFAPLLVLGSMVGLAVGQTAHMLSPEIVPTPAVFAVVGMAAYFTAIVRAPLTGIMLIIEMTGSYSQMLPLLVSCFSAYAMVEFLKDLPIYEALLERDLEKSGHQVALKDPAVMEFIVQPDALFVGQQVRYLGLPAGCILIRCSDGKREWIPKANTRMEAHMRLTAVVAPEASSGIETLRKGCGSQRV